MTETTNDPVHRVRYAFARDGDDLIVDVWMEPGGQLPEHLHPAQEERWSVISGQTRLTLDGSSRTVRPGDGEVVVAPGVTHALAAGGSAGAHLRCRVVPAGDLEGFLLESARAARAGLFRRPGTPRLRGARWAAGFLARYRETVVMSSPPAPVQRVAIALLAPRAAR